MEAEFAEIPIAEYGGTSQLRGDFGEQRAERSLTVSYFVAEYTYTGSTKCGRYNSILCSRERRIDRAKFY
jgi:hypothetical protein